MLPKRSRFIARKSTSASRKRKKPGWFIRCRERHKTARKGRPTGYLLYVVSLRRYPCTRIFACKERWPSGRRRAPAKGVWDKIPSRVRIPLSPPVHTKGGNAPFCMNFGRSEEH